MHKTMKNKRNRLRLQGKEGVHLPAPLPPVIWIPFRMQHPVFVDYIGLEKVLCFELF